MTQPLLFFAALLQFALAATFLIIPIIAYRYGANAQRAAEAAVVKQGFPAKVLVQHQVKFAERGVAALLPVGIALCLATLAALNLARSEAGRTFSWIFQPILLVAGSFITTGQVFPVRYIESAFKKSGDAMLHRINVRAFVEAASAAFPNLAAPPHRRSLHASDCGLAARHHLADDVLGERLLSLGNALEHDSARGGSGGKAEGAYLASH